MKMKTLANIQEPSFEYGSEGKGSSDHLEPVIHTICKSMPVEKIFHVGTYVANPEILGLEYDLLVLIGTEEKRPLCEIESLIENRCHDFTMVTASVYKISTINELLKAGNMYFHSLCLNRNTIFDAGNTKMTISQIQNKNILHENMVKEFGQMIAKARSFFSGACAYRDSGDYQLSSFMLHQVFEQALNSFLTPMMGFRLQTHNLNKLFLHVRRFSIRFCNIFPRNTDSEIRLYQLLHKAYIYGRYKNNFEVGEEKVNMLIERAAAILGMTTAIFYEKADQLFSGELNNY
jgi:uncharacterized protein